MCIYIDEVLLGHIMLCKWGSPILYYRAAPGKTLSDNIFDIYRAEDNAQFIKDYTRRDGTGGTDIDPLANPANNYEDFYNYIADPQLPSTSPSSRVPYNPNTFILVSAGKDGIYGTDDDVTNFGD